MVSKRTTPINAPNVRGTLNTTVGRVVEMIIDKVQNFEQKSNVNCSLQTKKTPPFHK